MRKNPRRILSYTRTLNKALTPITMNCDESTPTAFESTSNGKFVVIGSTSWGLLVGTNLGTIRGRMNQPHTATILLFDCIMHITCLSRTHADQIAASFDALEARVRPATPSEIAMAEYAGVIDGGTLIDRLQIDDYFAKLEGVCR
jgi:hypothetical protein